MSLLKQLTCKHENVSVRVSTEKTFILCQKCGKIANTIEWLGSTFPESEPYSERENLKNSLFWLERTTLEKIALSWNGNRDINTKTITDVDLIELILDSMGL